MILSDGNTTLEYFEKFPRDIKAIGLNLSGGVDSAFTYYCLLKTIHDKGLQTHVYPIHGVDTAWPSHKSWEKALQVRDWVVGKFNILKIDGRAEPISIFPYEKKLDVNKLSFFSPVLEYMKRRYEIEEVIFSDSQGMPDNPRPTDDAYMLLDYQKKNPLRYPLAHIDKKFIAGQYEELGIQELSNITGSCITGLYPPCKQCWWCEERKWAFGTYDGGVD